MIKKMYYEPLVADTVSHMIGESLESYINDNNLAILGQPLPNIEKQTVVNFKEDKDFTFYYDIAFKPAVEFELNEKMKANFYDIQAGDDVVEKYLTEIRQRFGNQSNPESVEEKDLVFGTIAEVGKTDENSTKTSIQIENIKLKTIQKQFVGSKKDDVIVFNPTKAFKNDQDVAALFNVNIERVKEFGGDYEFKIADISRIELAELNEELYSKVYENSAISTEEELRARIRKDVEDTFKMESERKLLNDVTKTLIDKTNLNLPDEFLKRWILENHRDEKEENRITKEQLEMQYDSYRDSLRWQLIEEKLITDFSLSVTKDDIRDRVAALMGIQFMGENDETMKPFIDQIVDSVLKNKDEIRRISDQVMETKLINLFKEKVKLTHKTISYDDFVKMVKEEI